MILCFELSMPNVGSWNGKWSEADRIHAIVCNMGRGKKAAEKAKKILDQKYYRHDFGDGWAAGINVYQVDAKEANRIRRKSCGFAGYDWMVRSIKEHGDIIT